MLKHNKISTRQITRILRDSIINFDKLLTQHNNNSRRKRSGSHTVLIPYPDTLSYRVPYSIVQGRSLTPSHGITHTGHKNGLNAYGSIQVLDADNTISRYYKYEYEENFKETVEAPRSVNIHRVA
jgi:hypothetical protein